MTAPQERRWTGRRYAVIEAPSNLGLKPTGVERAPQALRRAGLAAGLGAVDAGVVGAAAYDPQRDLDTGVLNPEAIRDHARRLAVVVADVVQRGGVPVVLGGDCSILIGCMLGLRRLGRYGLCFVDGHSDFYPPHASPTGEVADMDLAIVTGRGPDALADIDRCRPLVRDEDVVVFGYRDAAEAAAHGSPDVRDTAMHALDLPAVRAAGAAAAAASAVGVLAGADHGFWVHLDADVLDDAVMPAVDYRQPDGLRLDELRDVLATFAASSGLAGVSVTIYNPALDPDGSVAERFVAAVVDGLGPAATESVT